MAVDLYMQSSGSNVNAGSTTSDSASVTQTNGSWDITADTFIATGGTPFSGVSVGEWVSVYTDGATTAVYVAQVTSLHASGLGVVLSTTMKYGTKPSAGATGRSAKVGGAWASFGVCNTIFSSVAMPDKTTLHVKAATYANTTTSRSFAAAGSTTAPLLVKGYLSSAGDLDSSSTSHGSAYAGTTCPVITFTTGQLTLSGAHVHFRNIDVDGAATAGGQIVCSSTFVNRFSRCRIRNTGANAASAALSNSTAGHQTILLGCTLDAPTTATRTVSASRAMTLIDCTITGGATSVEHHTTALILQMIDCDVSGSTGAGVKVSIASGILQMDGCSVHDVGGSGVELSAAPGSAAYIGRCSFTTCGAYGINNSTGTNTGNVLRYKNTFTSCTSGDENAFTNDAVDWPPLESAAAGSVPACLNGGIFQ